MNRHYTTAEYRALCDALRAAIPDCTFTTDVMVGFPGEDEEEFEQSLAFVASIGFSRIHVFAYSRRPGTPAATAPHQVPAAVKAERSRRMMAAGEAQCDAYARSWVGRTAEVLLETRQADGFTEGYTPQYLPVRVRTDKLPGTCVTVRITGHEKGSCIGEEA